jgi:dihydrolipoamide dehydrogenase
LVNVGELEGRHAISRIANLPTKPLVYDNVSYIMFLKPEVAGVGLNEKQCREKGISYQVVSLDYSRIPRAIAMRNPSGFFKILVTNDKEMKVLGMRAVGPHASSAIQAVGLLIAENMSIASLAELIHPHPSLIEGIQECCRMLLGTSIFKPQVLEKGVKYTGYVHED